MPSKEIPKRLIPLIRGSIDTYVTNPIILLPFLTIAFVQLLILEILYFVPRFPLAVFFNPIVQTLWGPEFIHYPNSFYILPKLFQNTQVFVYIFVSSYFIAVSMAIISAINNGKKVNFGSVCAEVLRQYIHIFAGALISFGAFLGLYKLYHYSISSLLKISSVDQIFFMVKQTILYGAPYANLFIGAFVAALFAFVFPIIIIEKKKIIPAIGLNFKHLWGSFWFIYALVLIPTLFYIPVILLRNNISIFASTVFPEVRIIALVISIFTAMIIDVTIYTAITTIYLLKKENS